MTANSVSVGDRVGLSDSLSFLAGLGASAADGLVLRSSASVLWQLAVTAADSVAFHTLLQGVGVYHLLVTDKGAHFSDTLRRALVIVIGDRLDVGDATALATVVSIRDAMAVSTALSLHGYFSAAISDRLRLLDQVIKGYGALLADSLVVQDGSSCLYEAIASLADELTFGDAAGPVLRAIVMEQDIVRFTDANVLQAIYAGVLDDVIAFAQDVAEPDGGFTAWAMNARSGALTEYRNWSFNSYAPFGDRYIAADDTGLYELVGDRDQETPIVSCISGGLMELAGTHLVGMREAYIAMRGNGEVYLKLEAGKRHTVFRVVVKSMKTRRVDLGRGWRARYYSWELITTGQDFDLAGLTFRPLPSPRRVD